MANKYYYFNEESCELVPIQYSTLEKVVFTACLWIVCGIVLSGLGIVTLSFYIGTPSEIALKAENQELHKQLNYTKKTIESLDEQIHNLAVVDNEIYRTVLGIDPISYDERQAGVGGADIYAHLDVYSENTADILKWTATNLESLERKIGIQKLSFEEIKDYYNNNKKKLEHIPAIRPVKGVILSGYGMRNHPVYKFMRMHEGLDFRAVIGTPVFATGEGTITYVDKNGTYGNFIKIDHGYGFESRYAHLSSFTKGLKVGKKVKRGEVIGYSGDTGVVEGPHLHYEILKNGRHVDPLNYLFGDITPEEYNVFKRIADENTRSMD